MVLRRFFGGSTAGFSFLTGDREAIRCLHRANANTSISSLLQGVSYKGWLDVPPLRMISVVECAAWYRRTLKT